MTNTELIKIREEMKLSKSEFAKLIGITAMLQGRYESGSISIPEKVENAIKALNKTAEAEKPAPESKDTKKKEDAVTEKVDAVAEAVEAAAEKIEDVAVKAEAAAKSVMEEAAEAAKKVEKELVKEVEKEVKKAGRKAGTGKSAKKKAAPALYIQSQLGGVITPDEVLKRIPADVDEVYVKPEENKAYWVKGEESGDVDLW